MKYRDLFRPRASCMASLTELSCELWLMDPSALHAMIDEASTAMRVANNSSLRAALRTDVEPEPMAMDDGVAHIAIRGPMMRRVPAMLSAFGVEATSTLEARNQVELAAADPAVREIVLHIDSPGGAVAGTVELADAVFEARKSKYVRAVGEGTVASAAFWVASQADQFEVERSTAVGSIGVFAKVTDTSALADGAGVQVHVVRSGIHKGAGEPGTPVTEEHLAAMQSNVDQLAGMFFDAIERSRGDRIHDLDTIFDGRVWFGEEATSLGLADGLTTPVAGATVLPVEGLGEDMSDTKLDALLERFEALEKSNQEQTQALAEVTARAVGAEAEAAALRTAMDSNTDNEIVRAIEAGKAEGRVVGETVSAVEAYASAVKDPAQVREFIARLPVQVRPKAQGSTEPQVKEEETTVEENRWSRVFGTTPTALRNVNNVEGFISGRGFFRTVDGRHVDTIEEAN
jgi:signal peptide peptidase SppA